MPIGTQLTTYTTAGVITYTQTNVGAGITSTPPAGTVYGGMTHFNNLSAINGLYSGPAGSEVPQFDKQDSNTYYAGSISAGTAVVMITPFQATVSGYWGQGGAAPAAPGVVTVTVGSAGAQLLTVTPPTGGASGDVYNFTLGTGNTAGTVAVSAGTPLFVSFAGSGTAYIQYVTLMLTRVGV